MLSSYILRMADCRERVAFIEQRAYRTYSYTYRYIVERAQAFADWLCARGLGAQAAGEAPRVLLWAAPGARWAVTFYGCVLAGATVVPVDAGFSSEFLQRISARTRASLLVTDRGFPHIEEGPNLQRFLLDDIDALPSPQARDREPPSAKRDSLAEIVYTSGTTSEPRGVMITQGNLLANLEPVEHEIRRYELLGIPFRPIRFIHLIPLSHLFGQVTGLFIPQMLRGVVVFPENQAPARVARIIRERRVSVLVSVPQQLQAMADWALAQLSRSDGNPELMIEQARNEHWSVLKRWWKFRGIHHRLGWKMWAFVVGGATLPSSLEVFWNTLGYAVIQGYGLTETAPAITITHPFKIRHGSVGRPLAGAETRIAEDGEILVRGANVSPGYYGDTTATQKSFEGGWLHTGDLGRFDENGNLIYLGRKKEIIVTAEGLNVHPEDVERVLCQQPAIQEAAIVGKVAGGLARHGAETAEDKGRTVVHAVLVPSSGAGPSELESAVKQANIRLEAHQRVRDFSVWPEPSLPRTLSTSKIQRTRVAEWVNGEATSVKPSDFSWNREGGWRNFLVHLGIPAERIRPEARLAEELGISSLDRVEFLTWLEIHGYPFDERALAQAQTIADLDQLIRSPAGDPSVHKAKDNWSNEEGSQARSVTVQKSAEPAEPRWPLTSTAAIGREMLQRLLAFPLLRYYVKIEVCGVDKLGELLGPALFISNHQSLLDVPVIFRALPFRLRHRLAPAMGEAALRGHSKTALFWARLAFNVYLISEDPGRAQQALRHAGHLADQGYSTLLFPEGERTLDGHLLRFRPGVGVIAQRLRLPVVPLLIQGLFEIWPRFQERPSCGRAFLWVGEPMWIRPGESSGDFTRRLEEYYRSWNPVPASGRLPSTT